MPQRRGPRCTPRRDRRDRGCSARRGPVELPWVHDRAADGGAMPADVLGQGMQRDVGALLENPAQEGRRDRVIDHPIAHARPESPRNIPPNFAKYRLISSTLIGFLKSIRKMRNDVSPCSCTSGLRTE